MITDNRDERALSNLPQTPASRIIDIMNTDEGKETERGRAYQRKIRVNNPLERAESRRRQDDATVELDVTAFRLRFSRRSTFYDSSNDPYAAYEDSILEPCPHDSICNRVSEMIEKPVMGTLVQADMSALVDGFLCKHLNDVHDSKSSRNILSRGAMSRSSNCDAMSWSPTSHIGRIGDFDLESLNQHDSSSDLPTLSVCPMARLPAEIIHQIYLNVSAADFNSARHTCRSWYITSLDRSLLETMLKRGGWSTSIQNKFISDHIPESEIRASDEWLMSKIIARECALGPDWTGNGLRSRQEALPNGVDRQQMKSSPFVHTSSVDFTETGTHYPNADGPTSGMIFTVSACSKFLMVAHGCVISIYELNRGHTLEDPVPRKQDGALRPVTSVICPRRVLACSMDTSSRRYAIAVLLDGRMGLVCDLTDLSNRSRHLSELKYHMTQDTPTSYSNEYRNRVSISSSRTRDLNRAQTEQPFVFPVITAEAPRPIPEVDYEYSVWQNRNDLGVSNGSMYSTSQSQTPFPVLPSHNQLQGYSASSIYLVPMPIELSTPTIYAPLCSADDLPRSVALCPQRRCVAFGCSSGIELHWVDALTGQDLNRWFPLTAPSDYLYFLPPRAGVDSAKKLRLISSAGRPGEQSAMADRFGRSGSGPRATNRCRSSPFWAILPGRYSGWTDIGAMDSNASGVLGRDNSDHYRAVPLSDGYHILFTDPSTGFLCLGSDAPIGGPTKLLRKIWFAEPQGQGSPVAYTAGSNLTWGVRVIAAYGQGAEQSLWLFSIPIDIFKGSQSELEGTNLPFAGVYSGAESRDQDWMKWWHDADFPELLDPVHSVLQSINVRKDVTSPVQVRGQEIGVCRGLVDLAIDAGPEITIWAFGSDGMAKAWQIDDLGMDGKARRSFAVLRDGTIMEVDASGDIQMCDTSSFLSDSPAPSGTQSPATFDGTTSMVSSGILGIQPFLDSHASIRQKLVDHYEAGDILMDEVPNSFERQLAHDSHEVFYNRQLSGHSSIEELGSDGADLIDMLTGIVRIDIEIR